MRTREEQTKTAVTGTTKQVNTIFTQASMPVEARQAVRQVIKAITLNHIMTRQQKIRIEIKQNLLILNIL